MRGLSILLMTAALAGCATGPQPIARNHDGEAHLQRLLAGKVAGPPVTCLPSARTDEMIVVDDDTIAFRVGNRVYVNNVTAGCSQMDSPGATLVFRNVGGGTGHCRGDIATVTYLSSGTSMGSCVLGEFVPYAPAAM